MTRTRSPALSCLLLTGALSCFPSCSTADPGDLLDAPTHDLVGVWGLDGFGTRELLVVPESARQPTLSISSEGVVYGLSGINQYRSSLAFEGTSEGSFSMGPIAATRMAGPPEAMEIETRFLTALQDATGYRVQGNELVLTGAEGDLLRFTRQESGQD